MRARASKRAFRERRGRSACRTRRARGCVVSNGRTTRGRSAYSRARTPYDLPDVHVLQLLRSERRVVAPQDDVVDARDEAGVVAGFETCLDRADEARERVAQERQA